jgi:hypothetical protein
MGSAGLAAGGAGVFAAQGLGLLAGTGLERAGRQAGGGGQRHLLHLIDIDVETGPVVAERVPDDDFAPLPGELLDVFEVGRCQLPCAHR